MCHVGHRHNTHLGVLVLLSLHFCQKAIIQKKKKKKLGDKNWKTPKVFNTSFFNHRLQKLTVGAHSIQIIILFPNSLDDSKIFLFPSTNTWIRLNRLLGVLNQILGDFNVIWLLSIHPFYTNWLLGVSNRIIQYIVTQGMWLSQLGTLTTSFTFGPSRPFIGKVASPNKFASL